MSTYTQLPDISTRTRARSSSVNDLDNNVAAAFALLPDETELANGKVSYVVDSGVADAYVVAMTHTQTSYVDGFPIEMKPLNTNTGASTINVDGLGVKDIRLPDDTALSAGDIHAGAAIRLVYSSTTGHFHISPNSTTNATAAAASAAAASTSETNAAASASAAASSASSAATSESNINSAISTHAALTSTHGVSGDIVGTTDTQALTNKTITLGGTFNLNGESIQYATSGAAVTPTEIGHSDGVTSGIQTQFDAIALKFDAYLKYTEKQTSGTAGGASISGTQTRTLNTEDTDTASIGSLSSNQITLPAGKYLIKASCPAYSVNSHAASLYDVTNSTTLLVGTSEYAAGTTQTRSVISGQITLSGSTAIRLNHYTNQVQASNGLGATDGASGLDEIYSMIEIWRYV